MEGTEKMTKSVIVYASRHHQNTLKLVTAIARKHSIELINAAEITCADLSGYDLIGFASGIDFGKFYRCVELFLEKNLVDNKNVFFLYTCAKCNVRFTESIKKAALRKNAVLMGEYGCRGFNTYGPWKIIGGMNRNHPNEKEISDAICFYESLI